MTRAGLPLHRILEQPRRVRRDRNGLQTVWFLIALGCVGVLAYLEWLLPWIRGLIR